MSPRFEKPCECASCFGLYASGGMISLYTDATLSSDLRFVHDPAKKSKPWPTVKSGLGELRWVEETAPFDRAAWGKALSIFRNAELNGTWLGPTASDDAFQEYAEVVTREIASAYGLSPA